MLLPVDQWRFPNSHWRSHRAVRLLFVLGLVLVWQSLVVQGVSANASLDRVWDATDTFLKNGNLYHALRLVAAGLQVPGSDTVEAHWRTGWLQMSWGRRTEVERNHVLASEFYRRAAVHFEQAFADLEDPGTTTGVPLATLQEDYMHVLFLWREYERLEQYAEQLLDADGRNPVANYYYALAVRLRAEDEGLQGFPLEEVRDRSVLHFARTLAYATDDAIFPYAHLYIGELDYNYGFYDSATAHLEKAVKDFGRYWDTFVWGESYLLESEVAAKEQAEKLLSSLGR